jgi:Tfp pilus assembly protein PilV
MDHRKNHRQGFSLILSLTIMAAVVMLVVTLSAFVTIESRAAMNQQLAKRARLNALISMRLALAHLQQEAGPDRRSTARADITQPSVSPASLRNPMWTGVWRTDQPDLPPAWLVSGRGDQPAGTQTVSLFQTGTSPDYHAGYWAPWQSDSTAGSGGNIPLVGLGTALGATDGKASGLVSLPKVTLPDEDVAGTYAYWIGDEGIKARVNLRDARSQIDTNSIDQMISLRSPVTHGLLKNLPDQTQLEALNTVRDIRLLPGLDSAVGSSTPVDVRNYFHDVSLTSAGVLADSRNGGLKRDLSVAFEMSDAQFARSEFGQGAGGTFPSAGTMTAKGFESVTMDTLRIVNPDKSETTLAATPIFSRTVTDGELRGPTWWALRDYHRLYKQLGWSGSATGARASSTPSLRARALWPNADAARPNYVDKDQPPLLPPSGNATANDVRRSYYSYSDIYNGDLPPSVNPNASDRFTGAPGQSDKLVTRPLRTAASPYVQRLSLIHI